jgi:hypothetical protein
MVTRRSRMARAINENRVNAVCSSEQGVHGSNTLTPLEGQAAQEVFMSAIATLAVPARESDFDAHYHNVVEYVLAKTMPANPEWPHIPKPAAEALAADYAAWHTAYEATLVPHVPAVTAVKNAALKNSKKALKEFKIRYLLLTPVTEADWRAMGMGIRKEGSRIDPPNTKPEISFDTSVIREVGIHYQGEGAARRGKPENARAIFLRWDFRDAPPANIEDLKEVIIDTDSPAKITFHESDRGKKVYVAGAWQIERKGKLGPWSDIEMFIVP